MTTPPDCGPAPLVLGAYLRSLRLAQGLTLAEAAWAIRGSAAKLSRMETARVPLRWEDISTLMGHYGITDCPTLEAAQEWTTKTRWGIVGDAAPGWQDRLRACEHHASAISIYTSVTVPRIAQAVGCPVDELTLVTAATDEARVRVHSLIPGQPGQDVTILIDGAMLLRTLGHPRAMATQMAHLHRLATSAGGPRVLVAPLQAGAIPPAGNLYQFQLFGHELWVSEGYSATYATGADSEKYRHCLTAGLAAAKGAKMSAAMLKVASTRFERLATPTTPGDVLERLTS
ncbi:Scr1 family TA system antitoxin-like transcriptional regulator [Streptomyces sp. DASNCL29]|uniref:Scr1 family TA system antitoxin-like transcriptional regulator n=1 Tax=Streptomyces sp. DASNCL29 TaxID=2583819 RepID=UPI00110FB37B|nr:Scr1 family TA system antitoxin-like transcriptional regulator [Streptomyces sp. DASNCL29]TMU94911.1 helix-turn-helix domain-containing protein [Streptomyces sp. DASNCL29]